MQLMKESVVIAPELNHSLNYMIKNKEMKDINIPNSQMVVLPDKF